MEIGNSDKTEDFKETSDYKHDNPSNDYVVTCVRGFENILFSWQLRQMETLAVAQRVEVASKYLKGRHERLKLKEQNPLSSDNKSDTKYLKIIMRTKVT